jgi:hypothetical protein
VIAHDCEVKAVITKRLLNKKGASLLFVLGVMTLLLAIATTAIVAATSTVGADIAGIEAENLELIADSLQRSVKSGLQDNTADSLGEQLLTLYNDSARDNFTLSPTLDLLQNHNCTIEIRFRPRTDTITTVTVTVTVGTLSSNTITIKTEAVYNLYETGEWEVVSYGKIDV